MSTTGGGTHSKSNNSRNNNLNNTVVIDLSNDSVVARRCNPPPVVDLLQTDEHVHHPTRMSIIDDDEDEDIEDQYLVWISTKTATAASGKSDPNERYSNDTNSKRSRTDTTDPKLQVLEVFPDADFKAVAQKLAEYNGSASAVIAIFAEQGYPKSKPKKYRSPVTTSTPAVVDYMSTTSFSPTPLYIDQARHQLLWDFPFIAKAAAKSVLHESQNHYAIAHEKIFNAIRAATASGTTSGNNTTTKVDENQQYKYVKAALAGRKLHEPQIQNLIAICRQIPPLKHSRRKVASSNTNNTIMVTEATLVREVQYVQQKLQEWLEAIRIRQQRQHDKEVSQREGTAVECLCCFDSYPLEDMVACKFEGHLFCCDCLKSYAENLLFGQNNLGMDKVFPQKPALELQCFYSDDCWSGFEREFLKKALPPKTLETYDKIQFEVSIQRAGVPTAKCPKCQFQADVPPEQKIFSCPACEYESCRECGEAAHIPLRCDEVEKEVETKGRLTVEEAISAALIRKCPQCSRKFIKSDGCNKITCGCGAKVCYLCSQRINGYEHFCQTPHCTHQQCKKCPLHTNDGEDNARAMREAGYAAAAEVRSKGQVEVDVEGMLRTK